jgi:uncharacterized RDD family membrane protein YckC
LKVLAGVAPVWRRLAASGVDWAIVVAYLAVLSVIGTIGRALGVLPDQLTTPRGRVVAQLVVLTVLTVPVTLWFAWWEAAPRSATPGKRLLGLCVVRLDGGGLTWRRSLLRSVAKIAVPWELAHTGVWNSLVWPGPEAAVNTVLFVVANGLLVANLVMLFVGTRRPLYDRLAVSVVRPRPGTVPAAGASGGWPGC